MENKRDYSFFKLDIYSIVSLVCLFVVFAIAHIPQVYKATIMGLSLNCYLLSILALFIPIWNIIIAYKEKE
jgi:hypothetical protein